MWVVAEPGAELRDETLAAPLGVEMRPLAAEHTLGPRAAGFGTAELTWSGRGEPAAEREEEPWEVNPPAEIGRYLKVGRELGRGGMGAVFEAEDTRTGELLAVKLVPAMSPDELSRVRWERAALRAVSLPGVVHLRYDGEQDGFAYLVMERIDGTPFLAGRGAWGAVVDAVRSLLSTLSWLHLSGLVHGDLKPANVLVDAARGPVLVDFGIARGRRLVEGGGVGSRGFTRRYAAPEQLRGADATERSDLYALGVMIYEHLTGECVAECRAEGGRLPPVRELYEGLPPAVGAVIDAMVCEAPEQRPASALAVLEAFGGQLPAPFGSELPGFEGEQQVDEVRLRALFHGPDLFVRLRERAARELWLRTGGEVSAVKEELAAWLRAGLATWEEGRCRIDRDALTRLAAGVVLRGPRSDGAGALQMVRAPEAVRSPEQARVAFRRLASQAVELRLRGALDEALCAAQFAFDLAGDAVPEAEVDQLLCELVKAAWCVQVPAWVSRILGLIERRPLSRERDRLLVLMSRIHTNTASTGASSLVEGATLLAFDDEELCIDAFLVTYAMAYQVSDDMAVAVLGEWEPWASQSPLRQRMWEARRANLLRMRGRFEEARAGRARAVHGLDRLGLSDARLWLEHYLTANSELDAGALAAARCRYEQVLSSPVAQDAPALECDTTAALVMLDYRERDALEISDELLGAMAYLETVSLAPVLFTATMADLRGGREGRARQRAQATLERSRAHSSRFHTLVAEALAWLVEGLGRAEGAAIAALLLATPGSWSMRAQALGLLALGDAELAASLRPKIEALIARVPDEDRGRRRELISFDEALGLAGEAEVLFPGLAPRRR